MGLRQSTGSLPKSSLSFQTFWICTTDQKVIALTYVCRGTWREIFISRSSLWAEFNCLNGDKARTYLERSNSSPINLWIDKKDNLSPHDPLLQIILHATGQLKSPSIEGTPGNLQDVTTSLSLSAPLLEDRSIDGGCQPNPVLASKLFNGDPSDEDRRFC